MADLPNRETDNDALPFGELERDRLSTRVLVRDAKFEGLEIRMGRLLVDPSGDSLRVGDLVLRPLRVVLVDVEAWSDCCNGSSFWVGEFIDSAQLMYTANGTGWKGAFAVR